jgi:putative selenate reductase
VPVTACTDLLKPGGYGRARGYLAALAERMRLLGAATIDEFIVASASSAAEPVGLQAPLSRGAALMRNTRRYAGQVLEDERYRLERNVRPPRKIGRRLKLFDCLTCDKCVPVCPNDANFTFRLPRSTFPIVRLHREGRGWAAREEGEVRIEEAHQIGNFVDFCNDCGNCDVFCPEDGGPYVLKPRFFGSLEQWRRRGAGDGFHLERTGEGRERVWGRFDGREYRIDCGAGGTRCDGPRFVVHIDERGRHEVIEADSDGPIDITFCEIMRSLLHGVTAGTNWVSGLWAGDSPARDTDADATKE